MQLNRRQAQLFCNLRVLNLPGIFQRQTLDTFCHVRARRNGASTTECFEFDVGNDTLLIDSDLELHYISATKRRHQYHRDRR
jgi:hypothetical protein